MFMGTPINIKWIRGMIIIKPRNVTAFLQKAVVFQGYSPSSFTTPDGPLMGFKAQAGPSAAQVWGWSSALWLWLK